MLASRSLWHSQGRLNIQESKATSFGPFPCLVLLQNIYFLLSLLPYLQCTCLYILIISIISEILVKKLNYFSGPMVPLSL